MAPGRTTFLGASRDFRIVVKLIIPDHVVEGAVVHLVERGSDGVCRCIACTIASLFKGRILTASKNELLAERLVVLHFAAKQACSLCYSATARKGSGIELKNKPPVDWMSFCQQRLGSAVLRVCQRSREKEQHYKLKKEVGVGNPDHPSSFACRECASLSQSEKRNQQNTGNVRICKSYPKVRVHCLTSVSPLDAGVICT